MATSTSICSREDLARARRIVIKAGTTVVSNEDGTFSLTRLGAIVEQASDLIKAGYEVNTLKIEF
jgi:delta-1-pyrroline-5-carboxylate synthetase